MMKQFRFLLFLFFIFAASFAHAQGMADSTSKEPVQILNADNLYLKTPDPNTELKILAGHVRLRQGTTLFWCDSCVINSALHMLEAFGNVHINDNDTSNVY